MKPVEKCPFCGFPDKRTVGLAEDHVTGTFFSLSACRGCEGAFCDPAPLSEELAKYYPQSYYGTSGKKFHPLIELIAKTIRMRLRQSLAKSFPNPGSILEIGCGRGDLLEDFARSGWECHGTEYFTAPLIAEAGERRVKIHNVQDLHEARFPANSIDLIIIRHVLEHLNNPLEIAREIFRILKPSGTLYLVVPNYGGWVSKWFGMAWFALDVPRHLSHFTAQSMRMVLASSGLTPIRTGFLSLEQDIFSFVQTCQNAAGFPFNALYDRIRLSSAQMRPRVGINWRQEFFLILSACLLLPVGFLIAVISSMARSGGVIEIRAKKNSVK